MWTHQVEIVLVGFEALLVAAAAAAGPENWVVDVVIVLAGTTYWAVELAPILAVVERSEHQFQGFEAKLPKCLPIAAV